MRGDRSKEFTGCELFWVRLTHLWYQRVERHCVSLSDLLFNLIGCQLQKHSELFALGAGKILQHEV